MKAGCTIVLAVTLAACATRSPVPDMGPRQAPAAPPVAAAPPAVPPATGPATFPSRPATPGPAVPIAAPPSVRPPRTALLLPLGSEHREASEAIQDGYLWAYFDAWSRQSVTVYDTRGRPADALLAYERAVDEGASVIIGPLLKSSVEAVMTSPLRKVPTLALNYGDRPAPGRFVQFGLAPEDEARQAARSASAQGLRRAVTLATEGDWGSRTVEAFRREFASRGGTVVDSGIFDPRAYDHSASIERLLRVVRTASRDHARKIRRRRDIDMIFIASRADSSRMLVPQLHFFGATDLPIYATAEVNDGRIHGRYREGLRFCAMPLDVAASGPAADLRSRLLAGFPGASLEQLRLLAFGTDAYELAEELRAKALAPGWRREASTGTLTLGADGIVSRTLLCVEVQGGGLRLAGS